MLSRLINYIRDTLFRPRERSAFDYTHLQDMTTTTESFAMMLQSKNYRISQPDCSTILFTNKEDGTVLGLHAVRDCNFKCHVVISRGTNQFHSRATQLVRVFFGEISVSASEGSFVIDDFVVDSVSIPIGGRSTLALRVSKLADDIKPRRFW